MKFSGQSCGALTTEVLRVDSFSRINLGDHPQCIRARFLHCWSDNGAPDLPRYYISVGFCLTVLQVIHHFFQRSLLVITNRANALPKSFKIRFAGQTNVVLVTSFSILRSPPEPGVDT